MASNSPAPKTISFKKKLIFSLIIFLGIFLIVFAIGEVTMRLISDVTPGTIPPPYNTAQKDSLLGWRMTPNYSFDGTMKDIKGQEYPIAIRYDANGFKAFGDTAAARPKVLFIGDSYTASVEVSNEKSYFNLLKDSLDIEVFAYGHAGFGTLQEYMILDRWVDIIQPDVVVWEVCSNDFIDNYAPLEIQSGYKVGERRPYLQPGGDVTYSTPLSFFQKLQKKSLFLQWLTNQCEILYYKVKGMDKQLGEYYIAVDKRSYVPFDRSVAVTEKIVHLLKKRISPETKVLAFSADIFQPQMGEFKRIFEANGFTFAEEPARQVEYIANMQKLAVRAIDGYHWNETGHEIIAAMLAGELKQLLEE